jgi:hypothetical protein
MDANRVPETIGGNPAMPGQLARRMGNALVIHDSNPG